MTNYLTCQRQGPCTRSITRHCRLLEELAECPALWQDIQPLPRLEAVIKETLRYLKCVTANICFIKYQLLLTLKNLYHKLHQTCFFIRK